MKKTYMPFGKQAIFYGIFFLAVLGISIAILVNSYSPLKLAFLLIISLLSLYYFVSPIVFYTIRIKDGKILMNKDFGLFKEDRIQKKVEIELSAITKYKVIISDRNSEGVAYQSKAPKKTYVEYFLKGEEKPKRTFVSYMSRKQLVGLIQDIKELTGIEVTRKDDNDQENKQ